MGRKAAMLEKDSQSTVARKVMCFTEWLTKILRDRRGNTCQRPTSSTAAQRSNMSSQPRSTRRRSRTSTNSSSRLNNSNNTQPAQCWEPTYNSVPTVIRSSDAEHSYEYTQHELQQAQEYDQKYKELDDGRPPPNVSITPDGLVLGVDHRSTNRSISSNGNNYSGEYPPPPYSPRHKESHRNRCTTTFDKCSCHLTRRSHRDRQGSCLPYTSQTPQLPSYEMAVNDDNGAGNTTISNTSKTKGLPRDH